MRLVSNVLSEGARGGESKATGRWRSTLVVAELALSLVLLVGAGLLIQSLTRLMTEDIGYDPANLLTLAYRRPRKKYCTTKQQWEFHRRVINEIGRVPGVRIASLARAIPQSGNGAFIGYWRAEDPMPRREDLRRAQFNTVSSNYFSVMSIPVLEGRVCSAADAADAPGDAVVSASSATRGRNSSRHQSAVKSTAASASKRAFSRAWSPRPTANRWSRREPCRKPSGLSIPISRCGRSEARNH